MSSEGPAPLHVESVSVGVASVRARGFFMSQDLRGPTCVLHNRWTLALRSRSLETRASSVASSRLDPSAWLVGNDARADPGIPSCVRESRYELTGMLSALTPSLRSSIRRALKEARQEQPTNGHLSADRGPGAHRNCHAVYAGWRRGGRAFWDGDAWHADAVSVELSLELGSYNGGSGDFVTVNLLELTGDSSDRLEPLEEIPVELTGLDDIGRLPLPPQLLEVSRAQLGPSPASIAATTPSAGKRASSKRAALS